MLGADKLLLTLGIVTLLACSTTPAQNGPANHPANGPANSPANSPANDQKSNPPAGTANPGPSASADKKDLKTPAPATKPKKVWTNDDLSDMHNDPSVSVVGKRKNSQPENNYRYSPPPGQSEYMLRMYRQQLDQLQAQAEAIDKEISNLQAAKSGKTVDSTRKYDPWGGQQGDWDTQIAQLQKNKDYVLKQIDSVEEQIRKLN